MSPATLAAEALRTALAGLPPRHRRHDFTTVLRDIRAVQDEEADRLADLRDQHIELRGDLARATQRLMYADLDTDMRLWTQGERDELRAAEAQFDEAKAALAAFETKHKGELA
jgi:hypothetical protein